MLRRQKVRLSVSVLHGDARRHNMKELITEIQTATGNTPWEAASVANMLIANGWQPMGPITAFVEKDGRCFFFMTLAKYKSE